MRKRRGVKRRKEKLVKLGEKSEDRELLIEKWKRELWACKP